MILTLSALKHMGLDLPESDVERALDKVRSEFKRSSGTDLDLLLVHRASNPRSHLSTATLVERVLKELPQSKGLAGNSFDTNALSGAVRMGESDLKASAGVSDPDVEVVLMGVSESSL